MGVVGSEAISSVRLKEQVRLHKLHDDKVDEEVKQMRVGTGEVPVNVTSIPVF